MSIKPAETGHKREGSSDEEAWPLYLSVQVQMSNHDIPYSIQPINKEQFFGRESCNNFEKVIMIRHKICGISSSKAII